MTRRKPGLHFNGTTMRLREIERIIAYRHGATLPVTDDVDLYLLPIAQHLRQQATQSRSLVYRKEVGNTGRHRHPADISGLVEPTRRLLQNWCAKFAPHVPDDQLSAIAREACKRPSLPRADTLGKHLRLTYADRQELEITTIGAWDATKEQRTKLYEDRRRGRDKQRKAAQRRAEGRIPRADYEANSAERKKPWEAMGVARATWYRLRKSSTSRDRCVG